MIPNPEIEADGFITVYASPPALTTREKRRISRARNAARRCAFRTKTERALQTAWLLTGITPERLTGHERNRAAFIPRAAICLVLRNHAGMGIAEIGRRIGDRDHTTIAHAIRRAEEWRETDWRFRELCDRLEAAI